MNRQKNWLVVLVMIAVLILSACGGSSETAPAENDEPTQEEATATTATEEEPVIAEEEATAEAEPTAAPEPTTAPEPTATPEPTAEPTEAIEEALDFSNASTLEEIESINSFRIRVELKAEGEAFAEDDAELAQLASGLTMEGSFIKEPPAQHVVMSFGEGEAAGFGTIEFIQIDDKGYASFGGEWVEAPADQSPEIDDLTFISPNELGDDINQLEQVGDETINDRETVHLRGDKEILGNLSTDEDDLGLDQAEEAQLDLWIDKEEGFIVRMTIVAEGGGLNEDKPEANGRIEMRIDYTDFNGDFQIEPPEVSAP